MGYFDFLDEGEQDAPPAVAPPPKKRSFNPDDNFTVQSEPQIVGPADVGIGADYPQDAKTDQGHVERRASATSKVYQDADALIDKVLTGAGLPDSYVQRLKNEVRAKPEDAARQLEKLFTMKGEDQKYAPYMRQLEGSIKALNAIKKAPEESVLQSNLDTRDASAHLPDLLKSQEAITAKIEQANRDFKDNPPVSKREEAERRQAIVNDSGVLKSITERVDKYRKMGAGATITPSTPTAPVQAETSSDPQAGFSSAGISRKDMVKSIVDTMHGMSIAWGQGFQTDVPVNFTSGLQSIMPWVWPDGGQEAFAQWSTEMKPQPTPPQAAPGKGAAGGIEGGGDQGGRHYDQELQQNNMAKRQALRELAEAREMQSWPAIISYALLSMLIGPRGAFAFFSNANQKGRLRDWVDQLDQERREMIHDRDMEARQQDAARREAARQAERQQDRKNRNEDFNNHAFLNHQLILARAHETHPEHSEAQKRLSGEWYRLNKMADDWEKIANDPYGSDAEKKKGAAVKAKYWRGEADKRNEVLMMYTEKSMQNEAEAQKK